MSVFQPVPDTALVELIFDQYDQTMENTLYFKSGESDVWTAPADLAILVEAVAGWWVAELQALTVSSVTLREVKATNLGDATGPSYSFVSGEVGTEVTAGEPGNVTCCVSLRSNQLGRSHRGRNYFVGIPDAETTGNSISTDFTSNLAVAYASLPSYVEGLWDPQAEWVVVSRFSLGAERPFGITSRITTIIIVNNDIDSMERRLTGRGE